MKLCFAVLPGRVRKFAIAVWVAQSKDAAPHHPSPFKIDNDD